MLDTWTDDRVADLTRLHAEGYSAKHIGGELGLSRNAVIGKVNRLGLAPPEVHKPVVYKGREYSPRRPSPRAPRERRSTGNKGHHLIFNHMVRANGNSDSMKLVTSVKSATAPDLRCVEIVPRHLSLIELEPNDCRYPYGDGTITFCGHPKPVGSSYCVPHKALSARQFHSNRGRPRPDISFIFRKLNQASGKAVPSTSVDVDWDAA